MFKNIFVNLAAIIVAFTTIGGIEYCSGLLFPPPAALNVLDSEMMKSYLSNMPLGAYAMVILGWAIGAFLAGFTIAKISKSRKRWSPMLVGLILTLASIANFISLPHPTWMVVVGVTIFIPMVFLGHHLVAKRL